MSRLSKERHKRSPTYCARICSRRDALRPPSQSAEPRRRDAAVSSSGRAVGFSLVFCTLVGSPWFADGGAWRGSPGFQSTPVAYLETVA
jgi:hypothetical protein